MVRSHTRELLAGPRPRTTCDRCHAQKLKCLKTADQPTCLRCAKHKTSCTISARSQRKTRDLELKHSPVDRASAMAPPTLLADGAELPIAGPSGIASSPTLTLDGWAMDFNNMYATENMDPLSMSLGTEENQPFAARDTVRELTNLNVRLYDHYCTLPKPHQPNNSSRASRSSNSDFFAIDETFTLTNAFITLLRQLHMSLEDPVILGASIDPATSYLVLSCFHRSMDIYGFIAARILACSQDPQMPLPGDQPAVLLPPLQIGSFVTAQLQQDILDKPLSLSTVSMHMLIVLTISSQLCQKLHDVITGGLGSDHGFNFGTTGNSLHPHLFDMLDQRCPLIHNDHARLSLDHRWNNLTEQFQSAKHAVVLCTATSI
jgi:hypothetical protein